MSDEAFDRRVRHLEGMRLKQVRYYENPGSYPAWRGLAKVDSVSDGVDLIGEDRSFCVRWDNSFIEYGLIVSEGILLNQLDATLVTNVTRASRWASLIGRRISEARIRWCLVPDSQPENLEKYPQSIELTFEHGFVVLFSAARLQPGNQKLEEMSDNVLVLFGDEAIREHTTGQDHSAQ
ncbi:hypothetical protein MF271_24065 (plasmid) [Deinococcus sp. KNUC1210]|uniref:hypothetical protein n=1 Tax=Deinococcus sp. KNUC1210 TaxID=2917691 RepID=UPI001EF0D0D4|nr:hypothetical protein [Deinococcus sp. KNUC1210]ULH18039.1 hypothetical protein MF271_24065 [Deinococcus sp. KNUC1210]